MYLIRNVSPALATSYAYVNPVVAVLLGTGLGGETLSKIEWLALGVICLRGGTGHVGKISLPGKTRSCASYSGRIKRVNESLRVDLRAGTFAADPLFQTLGKRFIRQLLAPRNAHSQTISTRQPSSCKRLISRRSRSTFLPIFSSQNSVRVAGTLNR